MGIVRSTVDRWLGRASTPLGWNEFQQLLQDSFVYQGTRYPISMPQQTLGGKEELPDAGFVGYARTLYKLNPVLFACAMVRLSLFSEARFQFRQLRSGRPGDLFGTEALRPLEQPWPNGTTGDLLARAIQDVDVSGNFYTALRGGYLRRMRPDWVTIVVGSELERDEASEDLDAQVIGYIYQPGGRLSSVEPLHLLPEQVCHFAPIPDPIARFRGMSWLEAVIRDLMADNAATSHKLRFFEGGATVNLAVTFDSPLIKTQEQFDAYVAKFKSAHEGVANAFRTVFLAHGSDVKPIGANLQEVDFKVVQGAGETRIAAAAGVPPAVAGLSEGLQGSSLNAGNYATAFRRFADITMRPLWRNFAGSMSTLIDVPGGAELWYDDRDIPALKEDIKVAAETLEIHTRAVKGLVESGFTPSSAVEAVMAGDLARLAHTGLLSVQMQKPGEGQQSSSNGTPPVEVEA